MLHHLDACHLVSILSLLTNSVRLIVKEETIVTYTGAIILDCVSQAAGITFLIFLSCI